MKLIFQAVVFHHSKQSDCGLCVFILEGGGAMPLVERVVLKKKKAGTETVRKKNKKAGFYQQRVKLLPQD